MQLEQQETFEIKSPQLEVFGQVESKLPAPAKKRPFAAGFLAVMVLVSVFGIGGVQLKSRYRNVAEIYTSEVDKHGFARAGIVILLCPGSFQVIIQQIAQHIAGKRAFQPFAGGGPIVVVPGGHQQHHAVVLVSAAKAPCLEHLVGIAFHGVVADVIGGVNADLCTAAVFLQGNRNVGDICFGIAA